jgi:hypothetical protein
MTIMFLLFTLTSCTDKKSKEAVMDNTVIFNTDLQQSSSDTLDINWAGGTLDVDWGDGKIHPNKKYPFSFFSDNAGICNLSNDTIFIKTYQGFGPSNSLDITISKGKFEIVLFEHNCTYSHKYTLLKQSLELNKSTFQIGDTLTGKLYYQATYVWDTIKNVVDTTTISGKFNLKIRDKYFDRDSLDAENNYKELLVTLSNTKPDTVTQLQLWKCGLTSLPTELRKFKNLETLELNDNDFKTADLSMLCEFKKLKYLAIDKCNLTEVPTSIFCLKDLERLSLFNNDISVLPTDLFQLTKIEELQLGGNLLTTLPNEILKLKKLKMLEISGGMKRNNIAKLPPNFFKTLIYLTEFYSPDFMKEEEYKDYKPKEN